jgi:putative CocE/NonD family hydrolase
MFQNHCIVQPGDKIRRFIHVRVPMRDGVNLSADIYLPPGPGPFPALILRTPYGNNNEYALAQAGYFVRHGYAFVAQDTRGRGDSDGHWLPFILEAEDGYDTVEWVAAQPWCTGKVGMHGGSYGALVQWAAALARPPHLVALSSFASPCRYLEDGLPLRRGILSLESFVWLYMTHGRSMQTTVAAYEGTGTDPLGMSWSQLLYHLPLRTLDQAAGLYSEAWQQWLDHPRLDEYWERVWLGDKFEGIDLPVLHASGWFDDCLLSTVYLRDSMVARSPAGAKQWLIIGPWDHHGTHTPVRELYGEDFGPEAVVDISDYPRRFFDHYLKGEGTWDEPRARLFYLGENTWRTAESWPPPGMRMEPWYLDSGGTANTMRGDGRLSRQSPAGAAADRYVYDPLDPTPAWPDHHERWAPQNLTLDQRWVQGRQDVLVYTSEPLAAPLRIAGTPKAVLYVSSDAPDTDFYVTLSDVYPDGQAVRLAWNAIRMRFRESLREEELITPGDVYRLELELAPVGNLFEVGHCIRVDVRSANFPIYDRNPNTGHPIGQDAELRVARQTVYHDRAKPSQILLPVVEK